MRGTRTKYPTRIDCYKYDFAINYFSNIQTQIRIRIIHLEIIFIFSNPQLSQQSVFIVQKLRRGEAENLAGRYFASNRANEIVTKVNNDLHRAKR